MVEGDETRVRVIKNASTTLKADIWAHFSFYAQPGKHDLEKMSCVHAVCKSCHAQIKYSGCNTTNLRNHISRFPPELLMPLSAKVDPAHPKIIHSRSVFSFEQVKLKVEFIYLTACIY